MSRKAFLIWGLAVISFFPIAAAVIQYLGFSKIIDIQDMKKASVYLAFAFLIGVPLIFGTILHLRFKEIGRRKRILALCLGFYILSFPVVALVAALYSNYIVMESEAQTRFFEAIGEWARQDDPKSLTPWSFKHKIDYILIMLPKDFLVQLDLFALLAFGWLDPRKPSKNRMVQFFKTGFQVQGQTKGSEAYEANGSLNNNNPPSLQDQSRQAVSLTLGSYLIIHGATPAP